MQPMYYIGLDVHKRKISYCVKDSSGRIHAEGSISATRLGVALVAQGRDLFVSRLDSVPVLLELIHLNSLGTSSLRYFGSRLGSGARTRQTIPQTARLYRD
jgi:hypothetical protein